LLDQNQRLQSALEEGVKDIEIALEQRSQMEQTMLSYQKQLFDRSSAERKGKLFSASRHSSSEVNSELEEEHRNLQERYQKESAEKLSFVEQTIRLKAALDRAEAQIPSDTARIADRLLQRGVKLHIPSKYDLPDLVKAMEEEIYSLQNDSGSIQASNIKLDVLAELDRLIIEISREQADAIIASQSQIAYLKDCFVQWNRSNGHLQREIEDLHESNKAMTSKETHANLQARCAQLEAHNKVLQKRAEEMSSLNEFISAKQVDLDAVVSALRSEMLNTSFISNQNEKSPERLRGSEASKRSADSPTRKAKIISEYQQQIQELQARLASSEKSHLEEKVIHFSQYVI